MRNANCALAAFLLRARRAEDERPLGHGFVAARSRGGGGISSICATCAAPWRCAVPRQSRAGVAAAEDDDALAA